MTSAVAAALIGGSLIPWWLVELATTPRRPRRRWAGAISSALRALGGRVGAPAAPRELEAALAAAGVIDRLGVGDAMAIKVGSAVAAIGVGVPLGAALPGRLGTLVALGAPVSAFFALDLWLRRRARERERRLEIELPDALELLRVAIEAGLAPGRALSELARRQRGLLASELGMVSTRIALGVPTAEALATLLARCPAEGVASLVAALRRADRDGVSLSPALAALAVDVRAARLRALHMRAARAAPKVQLVIALVLVPAVLALVAAALSGALAS